MRDVPRIKPLVIIGLVLFGGISLCGIVLDYIKGADGRILFPALAIGFTILAIFLGIEELLRRRAAKSAEPYDDEPFELDEENRFVRHAEPADLFEQDDSFADRFEDDDYAGFESDAQQDEQYAEQYAEPEPESPAGFFAHRRRAFARTAEPVQHAEPEQFDEPETYDEPEQFGEPEAYDEPEQYDEPEAYTEPEQLDEQDYYAPEQPEEDFLKPVMVLGTPEPEPQPAPAPQPEPKPEEEPYFEPEPVAPAAPVAPVAPAAPAVSAAAVGGQTLESFYADMSEEDILYRDCVEVWAEDAKPCMLKLLKYVEAIEDKQTQAAFGRECEYINAMLDRICFFNKLEYIEQELEPTVCNFSSMVKECLKRFSPFFMEKRLGLLWKGLDIEVNIDRKWFIFALTQVIFNSVEFTSEGGKIAISAKKNGNYVDLSVDDGGCGISRDDLPYVLMAGFMSDSAQNESGRRTGMGLFIARSVAVKMGGDLYVESPNGKGTRVTFHLPTGM